MPRQYSKIQYRYPNPSDPVDLHDVSYLTPGRSKGRPSSKHIEFKPVKVSRNDLTTGGVLHATTFRVDSRHPSTPSSYDVRRRPHFEKSESESGRSVIYIPPETWTEPLQPPQMSIRSFERATDIHIKGTHPRVRCRSGTDYCTLYMLSVELSIKRSCRGVRRPITIGIFTISTSHRPGMAPTTKLISIQPDPWILKA